MTRDPHPHSHHAPEAEPRWPLRHAHVQSALASFKPRNWSRRRHPMARHATAHVLDCGDGVRLAGYHSARPAGGSRGLVVLFHGWEGCHESVYLMSMACTLYDAGYDVFRLNLRDHGGTHHLNEGMFHSARMDEVFGALRAIRALDPAGPLFVIGFSLGGNFALRVGMRGPARGIMPRLTVAVCPSIDPGRTLKALDGGPRLFHRYFLRKWRRSLNAKQAAWPGLYDFSEVSGIDNFEEITRRFVERYTEFNRLEDYLAAYTIVDELARPPASPLAIITAQDDPVVPFDDFRRIPERPDLKIFAPRWGGHCGFVENLRLNSWAERRVLELLARA